MARAGGLVWSIAERRDEFDADAGPLFSSDWSPDGMTIVCGLSHGMHIYVKPRDHAVESNTAITANNPYRADVHWSPKGDTIAVVYVTLDNQAPGGTKLWQTNDAKLLRNLNGNLAPIAWLPNGEALAIIPDSIELWTIRTGQPSVRFKHPDARSLQAAWSPDGTRIASVDSDQKIRVWDIGSRSIVATVDSPIQSALHRIAFSPDGHWLACSHFLSPYTVNSEFCCWLRELLWVVVDLARRVDWRAVMVWRPSLVSR